MVKKTNLNVQLQHGNIYHISKVKYMKDKYNSDYATKLTTYKSHPMSQLVNGDKLQQVVSLSIIPFLKQKNKKDLLDQELALDNLKRRIIAILFFHRFLTQNCCTFLGTISSWTSPTSDKVKIKGLCRTSFFSFSTSSLPKVIDQIRDSSYTQREKRGSIGAKKCNYSLKEKRRTRRS